MKLVLCVFALAALLMLGGCTMPAGPVMAPLVLDQKGAIAAFTPEVKATRVGRARAEGIVFVGYGDASIAAAQTAGGISRIHHVDSQSMNIFGIYAKYETVVYGE